MPLKISMAARHTNDVVAVRPGLTTPADEIDVRASRSSGPGGQHANVTASRIEASFDVAASRTLDEAQKRRVVARCGPVVRAIAQDARSQSRNRTLALERLPTKPTSASRQRRLDAKGRDAQRKRDRRRPASDD